MAIRPTVASEPSAATGGGAIAILTTFDQILSSASNALIVFTLAQIMTAGEFGIITLIVSTVAVCAGFNRGALGTPLLLTSHLGDDEIAAEAGYALSWSLGIGLLAGSAIAAGGVVMDQLPLALAFAVCVPFALAQDVLRMAAIALQRPARAVVADGLWTAIMLAVFVGNLVGAGFSPQAIVYVWGASGLASAVLLAMWTNVTLRTYRIFDWWRTYWPARVRFGSLPASSQVGVFLVTAVAIGTAGSVAAAGIRGAMTMFGPLTMIIAALPMVFVPHAARTRATVGARSHWTQLVKTSAITSVLTFLAVVGLTYLPKTLGSALLGQSWSSAQLLVPYVGMQWAAMAWVVSVFAFFQSRGRSRAVLKLNVLHMTLQLGMCAVAGLVFATAVAIGVALAVSGWLMVLIGTESVHVWLRHSERDSEQGAIPP
jgi:O-antigen/teichoic acid export membrane protein